MNSVNSEASAVTPKRRLAAHISIMRLDHSIKNIFVLPGILLPLLVVHVDARELIWKLIIGFAAVTLIACSNYVINELLDAPFDRLHPKKKMRPAACGLVIPIAAYMQWIGMMVIGLILAKQISWEFFLSAAGLWIMGCVYNIPPIRAKEVPYVDVLTESVNNPLRMLLGWYMVTSLIRPPITLLMAYWMIGAYFMAIKRFSEYRQIGAATAGSYRRSFTVYTEQSLLISIIAYASTSMLFLGAFAARYHIELLLSFPAIGILMAIYFQMGFGYESAVQNPEKLYRERKLMIPLVISILLMAVLLSIRIPYLEKWFSPTPEIMENQAAIPGGRAGNQSNHRHEPDREILQHKDHESVEK